MEGLSAFTGIRTRRPDQTDCTTAAGSRCATSRRSETLDDRLEDPPSDNAARSLLPALTMALPPPSRLETRRASCASSCTHSPASRSSAARPYCRPRSDWQVPVDERLRTRKAEGQNQLRPSTRAVEGFAGVWVTIRTCGEVGFRLTAEAEIGRG